MTGELLSPSGHAIKGQEMISAISNVIQNNVLSQSDTAIAQTLINQLTNALGK